MPVVSGQWSVVRAGLSAARGGQSLDSGSALSASSAVNHSAAACRLPPTAYRLPGGGRRRGITLIEVLISIGIVAIGILSIASLLPVGSFQAQKADMEQRKSDLGLNAVREFKTRGMGRPDNWVRYRPSPANFINYLPLDLGVAADREFLPPLAIDPQMVAVGQVAFANGDASARAKVDIFPANYLTATPTPPLMKRITIQQASTIQTVGPPPIYLPNKALADAIFMARDDVVVTQPSDASLPAESQFQPVGGPAVQRSFAGEYSWLATLTPNDSGEAAEVPGPGKTYTLSVVVFNRRQLNTVPTAATADGGQEEMVDAHDPNNLTQPIPASIGGGEVALFHADPNKLELAQPGQWLMLCRNESITGGSWRNFKWYRVVTAAPTEQATSGSVSGYRRDLTLAGPDWNYTTDDTFACLFDGAVAVYQRTIRLESTSNEWSQ